MMLCHKEAAFAVTGRTCIQQLLQACCRLCHCCVLVVCVQVLFPRRRFAGRALRLDNARALQCICHTVPATFESYYVPSATACVVSGLEVQYKNSDCS
jgi:hypothetical protein